MEARFYTRLTDKSVECKLCPHNCIISPGHKGLCRIRSNEDGILIADMHGSASAIHVDPVEKKPLYHFFPGSKILSLGSLGCNFHCSCCQNYEISQTGKEGFPLLQVLAVEDIVREAKSTSANIGVAFTYNEPLIGFEFMFDIAREINKAGLKNVAVSNGYVNEEPLEELIPYIDAFNIDIKCFDEKMHKQFTGGELPYVLETLETIVSRGKHLEITLLLVPGINDDREMFESMIKWILEHLGPEIPLHISRYFPRYKMMKEATDPGNIVEKISMAKRYLNFVYAGNTTGINHQNTECPGCGIIVIRRMGYAITSDNLDTQGKCVNCGRKITYT
jgi:pyruvate formate lyase activating enzyme